MTLSEFLLARIAVAEEIAEDNHIWNCPASPDYKGSTTGGRCQCAQRHVLADLAAKRRIVRECRGHETCGGGYDECSEAALLTLRHLSTVYAEHPDYDEAWRP